MKEVKFRIFNSEAMTMHYEIPCEVPDGRDLNDVLAFINKIPEMQMMQSTGVEDKNGLDIYEGDIVKIYSVGLALIEWSNIRAAFVTTPVNPLISRKAMSSLPTRGKVIGNIYENPELAK